MLPVKHLKDPIHTSNLFIQIWILIRQVIQKLRRHLLLLLLCLLNSGLRRLLTLKNFGTLRFFSLPILENLHSVISSVLCLRGSSRRRRRRDRRTKKNPALRQR
uniref:Transmembrane protein n=1 Tax=Arabidopsis thaliana TaxID=3702 RepID=Q8GX40_ARATH|nr:unknown protein [Arabidopsis thaliana]